MLVPACVRGRMLTHLFHALADYTVIFMHDPRVPVMRAFRQH